MELDPSFTAIGYSGIADAYLDVGRYEGARRALEARIRLEPRDAEARAKLGDALAGLGQTEAAIEMWRSAAKMGSARARQKLGRLEQSPAPPASR
jgi:tetratricopeptide (TPR) repeat protein